MPRSIARELLPMVLSFVVLHISVPAKRKTAFASPLLLFRRSVMIFA
jgi:hypothetical protein